MVDSIIYLGKFIPPRLLSTALADSGGTLGLSNHNFEMSLIHGFCRQGVDVKFISVPGVSSFPRFNRRAVIRKEEYLIDGHGARSVGYFNLMVANRFCRIASCARVLYRAIRQHKGKTSVVVNTPSSDLLAAIDLASKMLRRHIDTTLIVPDIPSLVTGMDKKGRVAGILLNGLDDYAMSLARRSDRLVLLTEQMMDFFPDNNRHIVMEGVVDVESMDSPAKDSAGSPRYFLYTGTLRKIFGVMDLVDAFERASLPAHTELWICGSGEAADEIKARSARNGRIRFLGLVGSGEALCLQKNAFALVNPRTSEGEFTKYSFPSKTMEYLLSGNPVIAHNLAGIPDEYAEYILFPREETVDALAEKLTEVAEMPAADRAEIGRRGRDFVISQKNSVAQVRRIIDFINQG